MKITLKTIVLVALLGMVSYAQNIPVAIPYKGVVTKFNPARIADDACSDALNVWFDKTGGVSKMEGSNTYDATVPPSADVTGLYEYANSDGNRYMMRVVGSTLQYTSGDGNWTNLITTMTLNYEPDFATWLDYCWITNGIDDVYFFDGSVIRSSSTMPNFKYIEVYQNRLWGVPGENTSEINYSILNLIFGTGYFSTDYVNQKDGDFITGLKAYNGVLYVFKNKSIHAIIWKYALNIDNDSFIIREVSKEYGTPYDRSIQEFNKSLVFWTGSNIAQMNATTEGEAEISIVSRQIENEFKGLTQGTNFREELIDGGAVDFGAGSGVSIDTYTYSGSIVLRGKNSKINQEQAVNDSMQGLSAYQYYQTFCTSYTLVGSTISVLLGNTDTSTTAQAYITLLDVNKVELFSSGKMDIYPDETAWVGFNISTFNKVFTAETTYYLRVTPDDDDSLYTQWAKSNSNTYSRGNAFLYASDTWTQYSYDMAFRIYQLYYGDWGYNSINQSNEAESSNSLLASGDWQTFQTSSTLIVSTVTIQMYRTVEAAADFNISLQDANRVGLATHTIYYTDISSTVTTNWYGVDFSGDNLMLTKDTSYYIVMTATASHYRWKSNTLNPYNRGRNNRNVLWDIKFRVYLTDFKETQYGQYQSQVYNTGTNAKRWGSFSKIDSIPSGTNVTYYVSAATASVLCTTSALTLVSNYGVVNSTMLPYIMFFASITVTSTETPEIEEMKVTYGTDLTNKSVSSAITPDGLYYMVSITTPSMNYNGRTYIGNQDWVWTKHEGLYPYCFTLYDNDLYSGSSKGDGYVYKWFIPNTYDNSGSAYESFIETKKYNGGNSNTDKIYDKIYLNFDNNGVDSKVRVDWFYDTNVMVSSQSISLNDTNKDMINKKIPIKLQYGNRGKNIKLRLSNATTNQYFDFHGGNIYYREVPEQ